LPIGGVEGQGHRTLSLLFGKDLQQEGVVLAGDFAFAFDAVQLGSQIELRIPHQLRDSSDFS
jgi:hypothetical protein